MNGFYPFETAIAGNLISVLYGGVNGAGGVSSKFSIIGIYSYSQEKLQDVPHVLSFNTLKANENAGNLDCVGRYHRRYSVKFIAA